MNEGKYKILIPGQDFSVIKAWRPEIGTKEKYFAVTKDGQNAIYKPNNRNSSDECSEKICYELAKELGVSAAKIELTKDEDGVYGILSTYFIEKDVATHYDAAKYLGLSIKSSDEERVSKYNIDYVVSTIESLGNKEILENFVGLMVFDAFVGETDRHEENWGFLDKRGALSLSPMYDTASAVLAEFRNVDRMNKFIWRNGNQPKDFDLYIKKSETELRNLETGKKYKHFELVKYLESRFPKMVARAKESLSALRIGRIDEIVNKIPDEIITTKHKQFIIIYLKIRKNILLGVDNDKELVADLEKLQQKPL